MTTMRHKVQQSERIIKGLENELMLKDEVTNVLKRENKTLLDLVGKKQQEKGEIDHLADR